MASVIVGKTIESVFRAQFSQHDTQFAFQGIRNGCTPMCSAFPSRDRKLAWTGLSAMQVHTLIMHTKGPAAIDTGSISSVDKIDFHKLQNGSDIRGVAVAGVDEEPVNLTDPVTEAIASAFASWLADKKHAGCCFSGIIMCGGGGCSVWFGFYTSNVQQYSNRK